VSDGREVQANTDIERMTTDGTVTGTKREKRPHYREKTAVFSYPMSDHLHHISARDDVSHISRFFTTRLPRPKCAHRRAQAHRGFAWYG
jgi:hypothetical protein